MKEILESMHIWHKDRLSKPENFHFDEAQVGDLSYFQN